MHSLYLTEAEATMTKKAGTKAGAYLLAALLHKSALLGKVIPESRLQYVLYIYCFDQMCKRGQLYNQSSGGLYCLNCQRMYKIPKVGTYCLTCERCSGMLYHNEEAGMETHWQVFQASQLLRLINVLPEVDQKLLWILLKAYAKRRGDYVCL